jgi:hypothetical protein
VFLQPDLLDVSAPIERPWLKKSGKKKDCTMKTARTQLTVSNRPAQVVLLAGALALYALPAIAQAPPERLSDKDVKALIEQVDQERDKFEGNLDGKLKDSLLRSDTTDIKVSAALQDYQDNIKKLKERFTADYSASAELQVVLKQANKIDNFVKTSNLVTKGGSEWDREAVSLKRLAVAYGTTFPMPPGAAVRRMNDKEAAEAAGAIADAADRCKDEFDKVPDSALPKADKETVKKGLETLGKQAESVKSRLNDGKPATAEVQQLMAQVAVVQRFIDAHPVLMTKASWDALHTSLAKVQQAFELR